MDITREILNLQEAYNQVYAPQELTEEVEIAAQYFYEMGLNDEGVAIFIEELGCEEFGEFVYDLAEEYFLSEASETRLQMKGPLKSKKGVRAQSTTSGRVKKQGGVSMKSSSAVSSTIKKDRPAKVAAAIEKAKEDQPRKRPVLDALARQIFKGMERHKAAMGAARETGKTVGKAAKGASSLAKGFASGMGLAGRIGKRVMTGEEVDLFDYVLEHLIAEGYADTNESALVIMANMSEEWRQSIVERGIPNLSIFGGNSRRPAQTNSTPKEPTVASPGGAGGKVTVNKSYPATLNKEKGVKTYGPTGTEYFTPNISGTNIPDTNRHKFKSVASKQYERVPNSRGDLTPKVDDATKYDPAYKPISMRK